MKKYEGRRQMKLKKIMANVLEVGIFGTILGCTVHFNKKALREEKEMKERYKSYYELIHSWFENKNNGKTIEKYFVENNISNIAIYGKGTLGEMFYEEIKNTDINIKYFIDRSVEEVYEWEEDIPVIGIKHIEKQDVVDAIIITPIFDYDEIQEDLENNGVDFTMVSLEDVIYI